MVPMSFILQEPERWVGILVALACMSKGGQFGLSTYPILYEVDNRQAKLIINVYTNKKIKVSYNGEFNPTFSTWEQFCTSILVVLQPGLSGQSFSSSNMSGYASNTTPRHFGRWMGEVSLLPFF